MLVFAGKVHDLRHLGLRNFVRKDPTFTYAVVMNMQHDLRRGLAVLVEKPLQHVHDELHRGVIVVENQHAIEAGLLGLRLGPGDDCVARRAIPGPAPTLVVRGTRTHVARFARFSDTLTPYNPVWPASHVLLACISNSDGSRSGK